jgi:hyaluronan synthase
MEQETVIERNGAQSAAPSSLGRMFSMLFVRLASAQDLAQKVFITLAVALVVGLTSYACFRHFNTLTNMYLNYNGQVVLTIFAGVILLNALIMAWRMYQVWTYKPIPSVSDAELPLCTVVIPAYNEGSQVLYTIRSVAGSNYPAEKLQIIAIDDGSKDDTWHWMLKAQEEYGDRVELYQMPANRGKKRALYEGFTRARGEVFVTIDSDSEVESDTIRNLVSPFQVDPRVGGCSGNVRVLNFKEGFLPRMMEVGFSFSFDFMRASESRVNTVMCTPGALSAYRASALKPSLEEWLDQRFLGKPANIGEDRALANYVLREGYHILYQRNAIVFTKVPATYKPMCRMLLRWGRSNIREGLFACSFMFRKFRTSPASGARINILMQMFDIVVFELLKFTWLWSMIDSPFFTTVNLLWGALFAGIFPAAVYLLRYRSSNFMWAFPYCVYYVFALSWVNLWSLFTPHNDSWLTRGLVNAPTTAPASPASLSAAPAKTVV